ncbi:MAG: ankyrin repeat domain-containing protein [Verrucomicrobia bacterium]|nr:ankyrin repeat domain-containing protein [Verrucomicrobiota bacterium]
MSKMMAVTLLALCTVLFGCEKKAEPLPPPTAEAIAAVTEAAFSGNTLAVAEALKAGMPVDQIDKTGNNLLMLAAFNGHTETMQALLSAGADVALRDSNGRTALMFASSGPFPAAVRLLLEHGSEINAVDKEEHFSPLMFAAGEGLSPIVDILLEAGADPSMVDVDNDTAANFARQRGFIALADKLQALIEAP